jgi:hypothetical protein
MQPRLASSWGRSSVHRCRRVRTGGGRCHSALAALALALAVLATLSCARPPPATAPPSAPAAPAAPVRLLEGCGGPGPDALLLTMIQIPEEPALRRAICDWFSDEPWHVSFRSIGDALPSAEYPSQGELCVTLLVSPEYAQLNVTAPPRDESSAPARWLERVALVSGFDEVGIEVVAQTLHSTAQASLSRAPLPPPPPPSLPPPLLPSVVTSTGPRSLDVPTSAPSSGWRPPVHTALGYQLYAHGSEPMTHGPSLRIELDWLSRGVVLGAFVRTALFTSAPVRASGVELDLMGIGLGGGMSASLPWGRWIGRAALGASVDLLDVDVSVQDASAVRSLGGGRPRPRVFLTSELGVTSRFGPVELGLVGLLRWQTSSSHYDIKVEEGEPRTIVTAWRLQPGAALEVAYVW